MSFGVDRSQIASLPSVPLPPTLAEKRYSIDGFLICTWTGPARLQNIPRTRCKSLAVHSDLL